MFDILPSEIKLEGVILPQEQILSQNTKLEIWVMNRWLYPFIKD